MGVDVDVEFDVAVYIALGVVFAFGLVVGFVEKAKHPRVVRKLPVASFILMTSI